MSAFLHSIYPFRWALSGGGKWYISGQSRDQMDFLNQAGRVFPANRFKPNGSHAALFATLTGPLRYRILFFSDASCDGRLWSVHLWPLFARAWLSNTIHGHLCGTNCLPPQAELTLCSEVRERRE